MILATLEKSKEMFRRMEKEEFAELLVNGKLFTSDYIMLPLEKGGNVDFERNKFIISKPLHVSEIEMLNLTCERKYNFRFVSCFIYNKQSIYGIMSFLFSIIDKDVLARYHAEQQNL